MIDDTLSTPLLQSGLDAVAAWYIAGLSTYHLFTGAISYFAPSFALRFYRGAYGCNPVERRHLLIILRPWGALAIFAGIAGLAALRVPAARGWIELALLALLLMRFGYRFNLREELREISGITLRHNLINIALLVLGAMLLVAALLGAAWRIH